MEKHLIKKSGITLIALVVTIVVLLILAGVSLNLVLGNNGIITKGKEAKLKTEQSQILEDLRLEIYNKHMGDIEGSRRGLEYLQSTGKVDTNSVVQAEKINAGISTGKGNMINGDVYYLEEGELYYKDENQVINDLGQVYVDTDALEFYYGSPSIQLTDTQYFTFILDDTTGTAILTGIKGEYAVKNYYGHSCGIVDNGTYIQDVVLPYSVKEKEKSYLITEIADNAFDTYTGASNQNYAIKSIVIPNSVIKIGKKAFGSCNYMKKINIPASITTIGNNAFYYCNALTEITVPESVVTMESQVFQYCYNMKNIYCEAESQPDGWDSNWKGYNSAVVTWNSKQ